MDTEKSRLCSLENVAMASTIAPGLSNRAAYRMGPGGLVSLAGMRTARRSNGLQGAKGADRRGARS